MTCPRSTIPCPAAVERLEEVRPTRASTCCCTVVLCSRFEVTYHAWSAITAPRFSVNVYRPALSVVVCATWWKLDWRASLRHSITWAPATGVPTAAPEITTFCPALDGSGEAAMVRLPGPHGDGVQQVLDAVAGQHVVPQQIGCTFDWPALAAVGGQHTTCERWLPVGAVGSGQHVVICGTGTGHMMCAGFGAAPAEPVRVRPQMTAAAATARVSESGTIERRIAITCQLPALAERVQSLALFHNPSAASTASTASRSGSAPGPSPSVARSARCQLWRPRSSDSRDTPHARASSVARRSSSSGSPIPSARLAPTVASLTPPSASDAARTS